MYLCKDYRGKMKRRGILVGIRGHNLLPSLDVLLHLTVFTDFTRKKFGRK